MKEIFEFIIIPAVETTESYNIWEHKVYYTVNTFNLYRPNICNSADLN